MTNSVSGLFGRLRKAIKSNPAALAFIQGEQAIGYEQLDRMLRATMRFLKQRECPARGYGLAIHGPVTACTAWRCSRWRGWRFPPLYPLLLALARNLPGKLPCMDAPGNSNPSAILSSFDE